MPKTAAWAASGSSCKQGVDGSNPSSGLTKGSGNGAFRVSGAGLERGPKHPPGNVLAKTGSEGRHRDVHPPLPDKNDALFAEQFAPARIRRLSLGRDHRLHRPPLHFEELAVAEHLPESRA